MNKDLEQEIMKLQREIEREEEKIVNLANKENNIAVKKSIEKIHSNLKYLSIIVNGSPMELRENMKIREFIGIHFENLWRIPLPA